MCIFKRVIQFILFYFLIPTSAYTMPIICEIKYGEVDLEINASEEKFNRETKENTEKYCYKIGTEYNSYGEAIANKPIFACCNTKEK